MSEPQNSKTFPFDKSPAGAQSNFKGSGSKSNAKGNPNSTPWAYGRPNDASHTRTSSKSSQKPSASRANPLYAGNKDRSGI